MKNLIILLSISPFFLFGQTVDGIYLKDVKSEYIQLQVITTQYGMSINQYFFDFGQNYKNNYNYNIKGLKDKNGNSVPVETAIDALNFITKYGYELVESYAIHTPNSTKNVHHYILKKNR